MRLHALPQSARCTIVAQLNLAPSFSELGGDDFLDKIIESVKDFVMSEQTNNKEKTWISFRVKPHEYKQIHKHFSSTTCKKLSEYARKILLNKPVVVNYRNQSADEFLSAMIPLKNELNHIGNNLNQAAKKLHTLYQISEFKTWLINYETDKQTLLEKVDEIKTKINKIYERWLQG